MVPAAEPASHTYESARTLAEYLLLHYGEPTEVFPYSLGASDGLDFPERCVTECLLRDRLGGNARALDVGCAVGRASFELARFCEEVVGVDFSSAFIQVAQRLQQDGETAYEAIIEGTLVEPRIARVPPEIKRDRVRFSQADAMVLPTDLANFDVVLAANLICRLSDPRRFLARVPALLRAGGQLILTTPGTWLEEFTPHENWLGGRAGPTEHPLRTHDVLRSLLEPQLLLVKTCDLPFLIREHARKFQYGVAHASMWIKAE